MCAHRDIFVKCNKILIMVSHLSLHLLRLTDLIVTISREKSSVIRGFEQEYLNIRAEGIVCPIIL